MSDNQTVIANAALQLKNLFVDITEYPVEAQGTADGVQYDTEVETIKATTDYELLLWKLENNYPNTKGHLIRVHYVISFSLKAGTATADLKWKLQARNKDGSWIDMCAEQTETNIGTAYAAKTIKGYLDSQNVISKKPFEMRFIIQSHESKSTINGTDIAFVDGGVGEDTITQVAAGFVAAGLVVGDIITVSGSTSNDGDYTLTGIVAGTLNVATGSLTEEVAGDDVTISCTGQGTGKVKNDTVINIVGRIV